jgi:phosphoglycolate phosphatase
VNELESRRFRLLVFDWDGTLADSAVIIVNAIQAACRDMGLPQPTDREARYVIGLGMHDALSHLVPQLAESDHGKFSERYRAHYLAGDGEIPLFPGVAQMLDELAGRGHLLAVATGKSRAGLDHSLELSGLTRRFDATRCADEGLSKPQPDMLLTLMDWLGTKPDETLMIGDTVHDLEFAKNARTPAVGVSYGAHASADLHAWQPLTVANSVPELRTWLARYA